MFFFLPSGNFWVKSMHCAGYGAMFEGCFLLYCLNYCLGFIFYAEKGYCASKWSMSSKVELHINLAFDICTNSGIVAA